MVNTVLKNGWIFHGELLNNQMVMMIFNRMKSADGNMSLEVDLAHVLSNSSRRSRRGWCGVSGYHGIIHSCTTNPPWINPKKIPINPPNHHQLSSRYIYIYIVLTPLLDHSNYIPWLMTIRVYWPQKIPWCRLSSSNKPLVSRLFAFFKIFKSHDIEKNANWSTTIIHPPKKRRKRP